MNLIRKLYLLVFLLVMPFLIANVYAGSDPEENGWAKINFAGFTLGRGSEKGKIKLGWTFILKLKKDNIRSVKVYDVTDEEKLIIEDNEVSTKKRKWLGRSKSLEVENGSDHWLFSSDDTEKKFKELMTDSNGNTSELIQETEHTRQNKTMTLMVLM